MSYRRSSPSSGSHNGHVWISEHPVSGQPRKNILVGKTILSNPPSEGWWWNREWQAAAKRARKELTE